MGSARLCGAVLAWVLLSAAPAAAHDFRGGELSPLMGYTPFAAAKAAQAQVPPATPRARCGPGSTPEPGLQGRVAAEDVASGAAAEGYRCNTTLVGREGATGGY